ncbi:VOC family protein [Kribbella deserti]|uniref:VOC family protein n=1 Tax=Kribbella deserti TaxID=1926257 RepID=A0ABV6QWZ2_9ACTN
MTVARFKDLCVDVTCPLAMTDFWGHLLGLTSPADNPEVLIGDRPEKTVWINRVPEVRTVKQRVHLDVVTSSIEALEKLGAKVLSPISDEQQWAVLADPEGGEFCGFVRESVPSYKLMELVVDSADPEAQARWWAGVVGGDVKTKPDVPYHWLENVPGLPFSYWVFVPVPEPKTIKNRIHWDVSADELRPVLDAGATLLRAKDDEIGWHVCADPEGNEFCVFLPRPAEGEGVA